MSKDFQSQHLLPVGSLNLHTFVKLLERGRGEKGEGEGEVEEREGG